MVALAVIEPEDPMVVPVTVTGLAVVPMQVAKPFVASAAESIVTFVGSLTIQVGLTAAATVGTPQAFWG